jgi:hypothetical protein
MKIFIVGFIVSGDNADILGGKLVLLNLLTFVFEIVLDLILEAAFLDGPINPISGVEQFEPDDHIVVDKGQYSKCFRIGKDVIAFIPPALVVLPLPVITDNGGMVSTGTDGRISDFSAPCAFNMPPQIHEGIIELWGGKCQIVPLPTQLYDFSGQLPFT